MPKKAFKKVVKKFKRRMKKMKNPLGKNVPNTLRKLRLTFGFTIPVSASWNTTGAGGTVYPQVILPLNLPGWAIQDAGQASTPNMTMISAMTQGAGGKQSDLYGFYFGGGGGTGSRIPLFDSYKVQKLKATFYPASFSTDTSVPAGTITPVDNSTAVYQINDIDDSTFMTPASAEQHQLNSGRRPRMINTNRPVSFTYHQLKENRKLYINSGLLGYNQTGYVFPASGTNTTFGSAVFPNFYGGMKLMFKVGVPSTANTALIGNFIVEWDVIFKGIPSLL